MHTAANAGQNSILEVLLEANASVDLADNVGDTPLFLAIASGHLSTVRLLLKAGAKVERGSKALEVALFRAAMGGHAETVTAMLAAADYSETHSVAGLSSEAVYSEALAYKCVSSLLAAKVDVNVADHTGATALFGAVEKSFAHIAQLLLANGADCRRRGKRSVRQLASIKFAALRALFACPVCGLYQKCCPQCRQKYCAQECDKFTRMSALEFVLTLLRCADENALLVPVGDCRVHRKLAHEGVLEWALAMSALALPPYVLEHIFNALKKQHNPAEEYQRRTATPFLATPQNEEINENYFHLIVEERTHQENIKLFIAVQKVYQNRQKK